MGQIRRQTLISSLIIYSGFLLGAFNLIYVLPRLLPVEYIGLTRLIQDFAAMLTAFAGLGFAGPFTDLDPILKNILNRVVMTFYNSSLLLRILGCW